MHGLILEEAAELKMRDELDNEVEKQLERKMGDRQAMKLVDPVLDNVDMDDEDHEEEFHHGREDLKEDTIKTDKIEQIVDEDLHVRQRSSMNSEKMFIKGQVVAEL